MKIFYIAPYSKDKDFFIKFDMLQKVCSSNAMQVRKAVFEKDNFVLDETLELYENVDFFIADLSYERPSCYFEVGYAQALDKKVYLIAAKDTPIHQVIGKEDLLFYNSLKEYENIIFDIIHNFQQKESNNTLIFEVFA
jgi:nucleoside 2-deoxyribosyltransferase